MKKFLIFLLAGLALTGLAGQPKSFLKGQPPQWQVFEIRPDVDYQHAWDAAFDILIKDFDLAMVIKEDGYLRTDWLQSYGGLYDNDYRVRVTVRFAPDRRALRIKVEAEARAGDSWTIGVDSRLVSTLKTDIMGTIGRTTR